MQKFKKLTGWPGIPGIPSLPSCPGAPGGISNADKLQWQFGCSSGSHGVVKSNGWKHVQNFSTL